MSEPILDPNYWRKRLEQADAANQPNLAVFRCSAEQWRLIEEKHREILQRVIGVSDSILDCGCGYGRLVSLLPNRWIGDYVGIDHSPDLLRRAKRTYPHRADQFFQWDLREVHNLPHDFKFDFGILISIRPMMKRELGEQVWQQMETSIRAKCKQLLYLEYDPTDEGSIE